MYDEGQVLAATDFFTTDPQMIVAYVPMQGVHTIYATIGDLFAWLSIAGLIVLTGFAIARRPKAGKAVEAKPGEEPLPAPYCMFIGHSVALFVPREMHPYDILTLEEDGVSS